ncbi:unnamed protein product [Alopecurus aequalis]
MANYPLDPTPFLPPDRVALEVEGRPARIRVIHGELRLSNEDLAIITIIPMPQGEVAFQNVQEILVKSFGKLLTWDRIKSTDAYVLVKIGVGALSDIPASTAVSGADRFSGESWTCPLDFQIANQVVNHPIHIAIEEQLAENVVAWDQWAVPPAVGMIDMELQAGEFLELNDLMGPHVEEEVEDQEDEDMDSDITLSMNISDNQANSENAILGPLNVPVEDPLLPIHLLDLNIPAMEQEMQQDHVMPFLHAPMLDLFPFAEELLAVDNQMDNSQMEQDHVTANMSDLVLSNEILINVSSATNTDDKNPTQVDSLKEVDCNDNTDASTLSPTTAAPITAALSLHTEKESTVPDADILGDEGAALWKKHFSPQSDQDITTQVPIEWMNFFTAALLSQEKFIWAKSFLASQLWKFIIEGSDPSNLRPFVIPDICPSIQDNGCKQTLMNTTPDHAICGTAGASSTSAIHVNRKRKEKTPLVETEVNPKDCTEEELHKKEKHKNKVQKVKPQANQ